MISSHRMAMAGVAVALCSSSLIAQTPVAVLPAPENPAICALTDVKSLFDVGGPTNALACASFSGVNTSNSQQAVVDYLNGAFASVWGPWSYPAQGFSDNPGNGPFDSNPNTTTGTLMFDSEVSGFFGITLKGSAGFALYVMDGGAGSTGVDFNMAGVPGASSSTPGLSHAGLWRGKDFEGCVDCPDPFIPVPEPTTFAMLFAGFAGLGIAARRRRKV